MALVGTDFAECTYFKVDYFTNILDMAQRKFDYQNYAQYFSTQ